jgi:hypothetical protein
MPCSLVELSKVLEERTDSIFIVEEERFGLLFDNEDERIKQLRNAAKLLPDYTAFSPTR